MQEIAAGAAFGEALVTGGAKTTLADWDRPAGQPRPNFLCPFDAGAADVLRLMRHEIPRGSRFVELGFAPGKFAAFAAARLGCEVTGIDYSPKGVAAARRLFAEMGVKADFRCEDVFRNSLPDQSFDVVFSNGLIEHFDDPRPIIEQHLRLVRPGGKVIVLIPNYGGIYGRWQARLDPANLAIHNLAIMSRERLGRLFPGYTRTASVGRPTLWSISLRRPLLQRAVGMIGHVMPTIPSLAPMLAAVYHAKPSSFQEKSAAPPLLFSR